MQLNQKGFDGRLFVSTDWSNLNSEKWYVITAGVYSTKEEANAALPGVQTIYSGAYVKYTGDYRGNIGINVNTTTPDGKQVNSDGELITVQVTDYSAYIGKYSDLKDYKNEYWDVSMGFVQYLSINDIKNDAVYGNAEYGYMELSKENFESGVKIVDNSFSTVGTREFWEKGDDKPYQISTYTASYTFSEENGEAIIIRNDGTIFYKINGEL